MSEDRLSEAMRALRRESSGESAAANATRMRVLGTVRARHRRKLIVTRAAVVLLAAALGSTAWASATGRLPALSAIAGYLGMAPRTGSVPTSGDSPANSSAPPLPQSDGAEAESPVAGEKPESPSAQPESSAAPVAAAPVATGESPSALVQPDRPAPSASAAASSTALPRAAASGEKVNPEAGAASATPEAGQSSAESAASGAAAAGSSASDAAADAIYQRAHALHFQSGDYAAARSAWEAYLAAAPRGRFATFAHYNRALCLLRLGRRAEARRALEPFASGAFGGYRKAEAQSLLDAMGPKQ